ncbi:MAG TPA: hypothetical protein VFJ98_08560 [Mycobacteriales bacterium]|nr:hypothetical protein [Mycobacteriales bacterium]
MPSIRVGVVERLFNSLISPWHEWLDPARYRRHCDDIESLGLLAVASAHGPVLHGAHIADAFERVRALAGAPKAQPPGQPLLERSSRRLSRRPLPDRRGSGVVPGVIRSHVRAGNVMLGG